MTKPIYKIKESKDNKTETVFEKSNFSVELTMKQFKDAKLSYEKRVKELNSQLGIEKAKMENVARNHKEVLEVKPDERVSIMVYTTAEMKAKEIERVLAEMDKNYKEFEKELKEIKKQTGLEIEEPIVEEAKEVIKKDE